MTDKEKERIAKFKQEINKIKAETPDGVKIEPLKVYYAVSYAESSHRYVSIPEEAEFHKKHVSWWEQTCGGITVEYAYSELFTSKESFLKYKIEKCKSEIRNLENRLKVQKAILAEKKKQLKNV